MAMAIAMPMRRCAEPLAVSFSVQDTYVECVCVLCSAFAFCCTWLLLQAVFLDPNKADQVKAQQEKMAQGQLGVASDDDEEDEIF